MPERLRSQPAARVRRHGATSKVTSPAQGLTTGQFARIAIVIAATAAAIGCAGRRPLESPVPPPVAPPSEPFAPGIYAEQGVASWYGVPFHGRRAADGEIFDMNTLVAAHRTLPFGSLVRVTNLNNGKQTEVRIIDRGPFVEGRVLDLAHAAAVELGMVGAGTAPVRLELLTAPGPLTGEFTVQVGAFSDPNNADRLRDRLLPRYPTISIQQYDAPAGRVYRVRVGRAPSPEAARQLAQQLRAEEAFQTFVVRVDPAGESAEKGN